MNLRTLSVVVWAILCLTLTHGASAQTGDYRYMRFVNQSSKTVVISNISWTGSYSPQFPTLTVAPGASVDGRMQRYSSTSQFRFYATIQSTGQRCEFYLTYSSSSQSVQGIATAGNPLPTCSTQSIGTSVFFYMNAPAVVDSDGDGIPNAQDNCPNTPNANQADQDHDGVGDVCDNDLDGDGILNANDNCVYIANPGQEDADQDGLGDACDLDLDGDGVANTLDNCPYVANANQNDWDDDGIGDVCDDDADGDDVDDQEDTCLQSDLSPTIEINMCDSEVANFLEEGCSLADLVEACSSQALHPWQFKSCLGQLLADYVADGMLTEAERDAILACGQMWGLPNPEDNLYHTDWSTPLVVLAPGLLENDRDPRNLPLETHLYQGPERGTLSLHRDGSFEYVPEPGWEGVQVFVYKAWNGDGYRLATATITITPGNAAPITMGETYAVPAGARFTVPAPGVLANDTDPEGSPLTAYLFTPPSVGQLGFHADGSFYYDAPAGYQGEVTFVYSVSDGQYKSRATVTLQVQ